MDKQKIKPFLLIGAGLAAVLIFSKKKFSWLIPVPAKITSRFGNRTNPDNTKEFHNGIDLAVPVGTPIKSPAPGIVVDRYFNSKGGNQLVIKHDNGYKTGYAHLSSMSYSIGERVPQGTIIAYSGNTGNTRGAHLHFTLKEPSGNYINPVGIVFPA